jgi:hypothetical protein
MSTEKKILREELSLTMPGNSHTALGVRRGESSNLREYILVFHTLTVAYKLPESSF